MDKAGFTNLARGHNIGVSLKFKIMKIFDPKNFASFEELPEEKN